MSEDLLKRPYPVQACRLSQKDFGSLTLQTNFYHEAVSIPLRSNSRDRRGLRLFDFDCNHLSVLAD